MVATTVRLSSKDLVRTAITHFLGRRALTSSYAAGLEHSQELSELADDLNELIDRQPSAEQAFDEPGRILNDYAANGFDAKWYLGRYRDVDASGMDAQLHFNEYGKAERRFPNAFAEKAETILSCIDPEWYLSRYPDVAASGIDAGVHFKSYGRDEGRFANSLSERRRWYAEYINEHWYLSRYLDVARSGSDPVEHYIKYGHDEGRYPNAVAEDNNRQSQREVGEYISSLYRAILFRQITYFELKGWLEWYKFGLSRSEIRVLVAYWGRRG